MKTRIITAIITLMLFVPILIIGGHLLKAVIAFYKTISHLQNLKNVQLKRAVFVSTLLT